MSELPDGIRPAVPPEPRDAALGVVLRKDPVGGWTCLLGLRSRKSRFMPGHLVFPGGGLEQEDDRGRSGALARCVAREVAEEAGVQIPWDRWYAAGARVTPPMFPVRFDARFFVAEAPAGMQIPEEPPSPDEIERLEFLTPAAALTSWETGDVLLPPPVLPVLRALAAAGQRTPESLAELLVEVNRREQDTPRIEFVPGIWMLPVRSLTLPPATHTNVWLPGRERFVIVDPGSDDPGELARLIAVVEQRRAEGGAPVAVVLTHHHGDHIAGAGSVAAHFGIPVRAHDDVLRRLSLPDRVQSEPIADGGSFDLGQGMLRAIHTPGHAPGHLAFHLEQRGVLISGDLISGLSTILIDPDEGDMGHYLDSLRRVAELECGRLLPAHGPPLPGKALGRLLEHRLDRELKILATITGHTHTLEQIAELAYDDVPGMPPALTGRQTLSHLLLLEQNARAIRDGIGWTARE